MWAPKVPPGPHTLVDMDSSLISQQTLLYKHKFVANLVMIRWIYGTELGQHTHQGSVNVSAADVHLTPSVVRTQ